LTKLYRMLILFTCVHSLNTDYTWSVCKLSEIVTWWMFRCESLNNSASMKTLCEKFMHLSMFLYPMSLLCNAKGRYIPKWVLVSVTKTLSMWLGFPLSLWGIARSTLAFSSTEHHWPLTSIPQQPRRYSPPSFTLSPSPFSLSPSLPLFPSPSSSLPSPLFPSCRECYKLPQWGLGQSPSRHQFWCILKGKKLI